MKTAFITGVTGQDGSYLAELLLARGYRVHGLVRPGRSLDVSLLGEELFGAQESIGKSTRLTLHSGDVCDKQRLREILGEVGPDEVYHLAGQTVAGASFERMEETVCLVVNATAGLMSVLHELPTIPKLFVAGSSEMFGDPEIQPQDEQTPVSPVNPYGASKACVFQLVKMWRETFGYPWVTGILYNHESPRRGLSFVTRKITRAAAAIRLGLESELVLGDVEARRDWGDAREYVEGMWRMLQHDVPGDYVLATGILHSVSDVLDMAFSRVDLDWRRHVRMDPEWKRPPDQRPRVGDAGKAERELGWRPSKSLRVVIGDMVDADVARLAVGQGA